MCCYVRCSKRNAAMLARQAPNREDRLHTVRPVCWLAAYDSRVVAVITCVMAILGQHSLGEFWIVVRSDARLLLLRCDRFRNGNPKCQR